MDLKKIKILAEKEADKKERRGTSAWYGKYFGYIEGYQGAEKNTDNTGDLPISNIMISFSDFFNEYVSIKGEDGISRPPTDREKAEVRFYEEMMSNGYSLKIIHGRKGTYIDWIK